MVYAVILRLVGKGYQELSEKYFFISLVKKSVATSLQKPIRLARSHHPTA